jgi:hypothetical protein
VQRDEAADAHAPVEVTTVEVTAVEVAEEPKPSLSLEELVTGLSTEADRDQAQANRRSAPLAPGLRTARLVSLEGRAAKVALRGAREEIVAHLAPEVDRELIEDAAVHKDAVLVEVGDDGQPLIVGVVQTHRPREIHVTGEKIVIDASREVLLRAGRAALRLREDGDVELVGSRISAASRGLFRIVGRILRLN